MGRDATLEEAKKWIAGTPHALLLNRPGVSAGRTIDADTLPADAGTDAEVVHLTRD
jgi:hypothetical protein